MNSSAMNLKPLPIVDDCLFIDNSTLSNYTVCPRKFYYYANEKRREASSKAALTFGSNVHEALAVRYKTFPTDSLKAQLAKLTEVWETNPVEPDDWRTLDIACQLMVEYNNQFMMEEAVTEVVSDSQGPFVERGFCVPFGEIKFDAETANALEMPADKPNLKIFWIGKIDTIVRHRGSDLMVMDHKTTSMGGSSFFTEYHTSGQMRGYAWAASQLLGERVCGAMVNALICRKPTKTGQGFDFSRELFYYDQESIDEWRRNTLHLISNIAEAQAKGYYPMHTTQCMGRYGRCEYQQVCMLPPTHRQTMLESALYEDVNWDPIKPKIEPLINEVVNEQEMK